MKLDLQVLERLKDPAFSQEMRVWEAAKYYISINLPVIPIRPNQKMPVRDANVKHAALTRRAVDRYFEPEHGKYAGWNIGIAAGRDGGVFIVDIDVKPDGNGFDTLKSLEKEFGSLPETVRAKTPNGGEHVFFMWQDNCRSSTGKIGPWIDTRGGDHDQVRSHVVAFPSMIDGKRYEFVQGGQVADVPRWVMEKLGVPWTARTAPGGAGRGNEHVGTDDIEAHVPLEQVARMLETIDPETLTYDEWLQIGQAIHSQHPGEVGVEAWDEWSQRDEDRYHPGECSRKWSSFDGTGNIRMGTLYHFAKQSGWSPKPQDQLATPMDELVAELNQTYGMVHMGGKVKILRVKKVKTEEQQHNAYDLMDRDSFKALLANKKAAVINPATGKATMKTHAEIWEAHHARRTYEEGIGLFPKGAPPGWFNVWQGFTVAPKEGNVDPYLDHIRDVICSGDTKMMKWIIDWMAFCVQEPGRTPGTAIVMRGEEGSGKGMFATPFGELWGPHFLHMIDEHHLTTNFNSHMLHAVVVYADEVVWGGQKKAASKIKGLVTEKDILYEMKGVDSFMGRNHVHLIMATNEEWAVPAGANSRRWCVLDVSDRRVGNRDYFDRLEMWRNNGGLPALLHYLMNRHLSKDDKAELFRAPETEAVSEQRAMHQMADNIAAWWQQKLEMGTNNLSDIDPATGAVEPGSMSHVWATTCLKIEIYEDYERWCKERGVPSHSIRSPNLLNRRLVKYGCSDAHESGEKLRVTGGQHRPYYMLIPRMEVARQQFTKATGIRVE